MTTVPHKPPFDAELVEVTPPIWWHEQVPDGWRLPHVLGLEPVQDKALIEKEEPDGR